MNAVYIDPDGHRWLVTGHWCNACGLPLHVSQVAFGTHPNCDPDGVAA